MIHVRHLGADGIVESFSASPLAVDPSLDKDTAWQTRITKENRWIFTFEGLDSVKNPCHPCLQIQCVYSPGNAVVLHFHLECGELAYGSYCSTSVLRSRVSRVPLGGLLPLFRIRHNKSKQLCQPLLQKSV